MLKDYGRLREVKEGPDGYLYLLIQNLAGDNKTGGAILRLVPAKN